MALSPRRYLIFFCPLDLFYKCVCFLPVKLIFVAMKEVVRVRKIAVGIHHAHHHYHHGWFVMIATGWVKGKQAIVMTTENHPVENAGPMAHVGQPG